MTGKLSLAAVAAQIAALDVYLFPMETGANTTQQHAPHRARLGGCRWSPSTSARPTASCSSTETTCCSRARPRRPAFADAALRLLRDGALAARVGAGGRRLYQQHLAWDRIADHLIAELQPPQPPGASARS